MKKIVCCFCFVLFAASSYAQQTKPYILKKDTINLRGYIFDTHGKPVPYLYILSKQKDLEYNWGELFGHTDESGFFEIKGAMPNDTLSFATNLFYDSLKYYNKGSRYMVIYLPPAKDSVNLTPRDPVIISHKRLYPKKIPTFKIKVFHDLWDPYLGFGVYPEYRDGVPALMSYLNKTIHYPDNALKNNVEGTVKISFTVERDGSVVNIRILNGLGYGCDEEVINAFKNMPKWKPAIDVGRPVRVTQTITFEFKLTDK